MFVPGLGVGPDDDLPAASASTPQPWPSVSATIPCDPSGRNGSPRGSAGMARSQKMPLMIGEAWISICFAAANVTAAGRGP